MFGVSLPVLCNSVYTFNEGPGKIWTTYCGPSVVLLRLVAFPLCDDFIFSLKDGVAVGTTARCVDQNDLDTRTLPRDGRNKRMI